MDLRAYQRGFFMDKIRIRGNRPLAGKITIGGAKNAALPLMAASLLTDETLTLLNIPYLADISTLANLLVQHGVSIKMKGYRPGIGEGGRAVELTADTITSTSPRCPASTPRTARASLHRSATTPSCAITIAALPRKPTTGANEPNSARSPPLQNDGPLPLRITSSIDGS